MFKKSEFVYSTLKLLYMCWWRPSSFLQWDLCFHFFNRNDLSRSRSQNMCTGGRHHANAKDHEGWKYVGKQWLRDHLVAGNAFVSLRPLLNHSNGSINSVQGWLALDILSSKLKMGHTSAEIDRDTTAVSTAHPHSKARFKEWYQRGMHVYWASKSTSALQICRMVHHCHGLYQVQ